MSSKIIINLKTTIRSSSIEFPKSASDKQSDQVRYKKSKIFIFFKRTKQFYDYAYIKVRFVNKNNLLELN
jgi:hypothetical protein